MPVYEYKCSGCGHREDRRLLFSDFDKQQYCLICGSKLIRKFSAPAAFIFDFPSLEVQDMLDKELREDKEGRLGGLK